jgi:hypothetical protein
LDEWLPNNSNSLHYSLVNQRLTFRSTRTPPALSSALSLHSASSAAFIALVQAWPVGFIR